MHLKKTVAIIDMGNTGKESEALRQSIEFLGYVVVMYLVGRPQHFIDILSGDTITQFDFIIISCHGDDGEIIMPELGEDIYFPNEPRKNFGFNEIDKYLSLENTCIINLGCSTGNENMSKAFAKNNNIYIAPTDEEEGDSGFIFTVLLFYCIARYGFDIETAYKKASSIDSETNLFMMKKQEIN